MDKQIQNFYKTFNKAQKKDLHILAKKLLDDSQGFFDKNGGFGCSIGAIIELVAQLADDIMWKELNDKHPDIAAHKGGAAWRLA